MKEREQRERERERERGEIESKESPKNDLMLICKSSVNAHWV